MSDATSDSSRAILTQLALVLLFFVPLCHTGTKVERLPLVGRSTAAALANASVCVRLHLHAEEGVALDVRGIEVQFEMVTRRMSRVNWNITVSPTPESTVDKLRRLENVKAGSYEWVGTPQLLCNLDSCAETQPPSCRRPMPSLRACRQCFRRHTSHPFSARPA